MSVQHPHTKLLNAAARDVLRPLGITQKGRSRTWLDDRGWWLGVSEFQPSSWDRGSYLNVGVNWLWDAKDYLSFDFGHRVDGLGKAFVRYESYEQFLPLARELAMVAAEKARGYRELFPTIEACAHELRQAETLLQSLNAGVALGLAGDSSAAREMFARYLSWFESEALELRRDDHEARYKRAQLLSALAPNVQVFRQRIRDDVYEARARLKLPPDVELPF
jgi:hypothetical protein